MIYRAVGLMSGSSLDGLDIAYTAGVGSWRKTSNIQGSNDNVVDRDTEIEKTRNCINQGNRCL